MDEVQQPHVERMAIDYSYGDFLTVVRLAEENGRVDKERVEQMLQKMPSVRGSSSKLEAMLTP